MFDSVIRPKQNRRSSWGAGVTIAVIIHASSLVLTVWLSRRAPADQVKHDVVVAFIKAPPPPPPPPPPAKKATPKKPRLDFKPIRKPDTIVTPKEVPPEKPPEEEPASDDEGVEGGVEGGVPGGVVGGVIGGVVTPAPPPPPAKRIEITDHTVLTKLSGPEPEYTQQALDREIEGTMLVKCTLAVDGSIRHCQVLKTLPFMDRAVTSALERRRYKPWISNGAPVEVDVTFRIVLKLPR